MPQQNIISIKLDDNASAGLKKIQQEAAKTVEAVKKIADAFSGFSKITSVLTGLINQQQNLTAAFNTTSQALNTTGASLTHAGASITGFIKQEHDLTTALTANEQILKTENTELGKFKQNIEQAGTAIKKSATEPIAAMTKGQDNMSKGFGKLGDTIRSQFSSALDSANNIIPSAQDTSNTVLNNYGSGNLSLSPGRIIHDTMVILFRLSSLFMFIGSTILHLDKIRLQIRAWPSKNKFK